MVDPLSIAGSLASIAGLRGQQLADVRSELVLGTVRLTRIVDRMARVSELLWFLSRSESRHVRRRDLNRLDELVGDVPPAEAGGSDEERDQFYRVVRFQLDRFLSDADTVNDRKFRRYAASQARIADRLLLAAADSVLEG